MAGVVDPAPLERNLCLDLLGTLERRKQYARRVSAPRTGDTGKLNWFVPTILLRTLAWASTFAEMLLGLALVVDFSRELQHC